jgi:endonuclease/exonuclease/phosphatase (EEP) superfamily protein YafD
VTVAAWARVAVGAAIGLLGAATVLGFLDRVAWPFTLVNALRLQYAGLLVVLALPAILLRLHRAGAAAVVLAALNVAVVWLGSPEGARATANGVPLRLLLVNVNSANDRYLEIVRLAASARPDVLGVIELDGAWARELERRLPAYEYRLLAPENGAYGIGVFSRVPLAARVERFPASDGPRTVVASLRPPGAAPMTLVLTHVHTPFAGSIHARHLHALAEARPRLGSRLALCGDFNTVPWAAAFGRLAETGLGDLYDRWWPGYSWPTWNPLLRLPIDNCLVGGLGIAGHRRGPDIGSDHYPLIVDLVVPEAA